MRDRFRRSLFPLLAAAFTAASGVTTNRVQGSLWTQFAFYGASVGFIALAGWMVATSSSDSTGQRKLWKTRQRVVSKVLPSIYRQYTPVWLGGPLLKGLTIPTEYYSENLAKTFAGNKIDSEVMQPNSVQEAYEASGGALLILGEAGSGKTHALVGVMLEYLKKCEKKKDAPIPFYIDLGGWDNPQEEFMEWCTNYISTRYGIDKKIVNAWMQEDDTLLVCDSLDQLDRRGRAKCIAAINKFMATHGIISIIIASRDREYFESKRRLNVRGRIHFKLLSIETIDAELNKLDLGHQGLAKKMQSDRRLRELLRVPLFLNLAVAAYRGMSSIEIVKRDTSWAESIVNSYLNLARERETSHGKSADLGLQSWLPRLTLYMKRNYRVACYPDRIPYELLEQHAKSEVARSSALAGSVFVTLLILAVRVPALIMLRHNAAFSGFVAGTVIILPGEWLAARRFCGEIPSGPGRMRFERDSSGIFKNVIIWCIFYDILGSLARILSSVGFNGLTTILFMAACAPVAFYPFHVIAKNIAYDSDRLPSYPGEEVRSLVVFSLACAGFTATSLYFTLFLTESPLMRGMLRISLPNTAFLTLYFILPLVLMIWVYSGGKRLIFGLFAYRNLADLELIPRRYWSSFRALRRSSILVPFGGGYAVSHPLVRDHLAARAGSFKPPLPNR